MTTLIVVTIAVLAVSAVLALTARSDAHRRTLATVRSRGVHLSEDEGAALERVVVRRIRLSATAGAAGALLAAAGIVVLDLPLDFDRFPDAVPTLAAFLAVVYCVSVLVESVAVARSTRAPADGPRVATLGAREVGSYLRRIEHLVPAALLAVAVVVSLAIAVWGASADTGSALLVTGAAALVVVLAEVVMRRVAASPLRATSPREAAAEEVLVAVTVDRLAENGIAMASVSLLYVALVAVASVSAAVVVASVVVGVVLVAGSSLARRRRLAPVSTVHAR
ncbi:hypothetical protein [Solicola sp. PLA-1-18]|uniref:hypothetical protein n=1 Tax=Solicola sp. PLA-1-18 TaxID=3380532 RepID=UPI003B81156B